MALTSASTQAEALAQYNDNLSWEGSASKALLALEAIRWLLVNRAQDNSLGGTRLNYADLQQEKQRLEAYVATVGTNQRTSFTRAGVIE